MGGSNPGSRGIHSSCPPPAGSLSRPSMSQTHLHLAQPLGMDHVLLRWAGRIHPCHSTGPALPSWSGNMVGSRCWTLPGRCTLKRHLPRSRSTSTCWRLPELLKWSNEACSGGARGGDCSRTGGKPLAVGTVGGEGRMGLWEKPRPQPIQGTPGEEEEEEEEDAGGAVLWSLWFNGGKPLSLPPHKHEAAFLLTGRCDTATDFC